MPDSLNGFGAILHYSAIAFEGRVVSGYDVFTIICSAVFGVALYDMVFGEDWR